VLSLLGAVGTTTQEPNGKVKVELVRGSGVLELARIGVGELGERGWDRE
jgi:hypothetical protein